MEKRDEFIDNVSQIQRIAERLVPDKDWYKIHFEGYIVGTITEVRAWYSTLINNELIEFNIFDLDYINEDSKNNSSGIFIEKIRELTYNKSYGAWYTLIIDFYKKDIQPVVNYDYSNLPNFEEPLPIAIYKKDLKRFPRDAASIPSWLR